MFRRAEIGLCTAVSLRESSEISGITATPANGIYTR